jgi:hypothetical protein
MAASKAVHSEDVDSFVLGALGIYQSCNSFVVDRLGCHSSCETLGQRLTPFFFSMSLRSQQLSLRLCINFWFEHALHTHWITHILLLYYYIL